VRHGRYGRGGASRLTIRLAITGERDKERLFGVGGEEPLGTSSRALRFDMFLESCSADWRPTSDVFASALLVGMSGVALKSYELSDPFMSLDLAMSRCSPSHRSRA
jgi:hypothetical protein